MPKKKKRTGRLSFIQRNAKYCEHKINKSHKITKEENKKIYI